MRIRILRLMNNFYKNDTKETRRALGTYCVFGHFDAMEVGEAIETASGEIWRPLVRNKLEREEESKELSEVATEVEKDSKELDGQCIEQNVVCIVRKVDEDIVKDGITKEEAFWQKAAEFPFLFVSTIRLKEEADFKQMDKMLEELNKVNSLKVIFYLSYGHYELTAVTCCSSYHQGVETMRKLRRGGEEKLDLSVKSGHTLFAVREDRLKECGSDELVNCRWQGKLKAEADVSLYINQLVKALHRTKQKPICLYEQCGINNILLEADEVLLKDVLPLYRMGELLTHTNDIYKDTWTNIETNLLLPKGDIFYETEQGKCERTDQKTTDGIAQTV